MVGVQADVPHQLAADAGECPVEAEVFIDAQQHPHGEAKPPRSFWRWDHPDPPPAKERGHDVRNDGEPIDPIDESSGWHGPIDLLPGWGFRFGATYGHESPQRSESLTSRDVRTHVVSRCRKNRR